jgi:beta-mannosidase
MKVVYSSRRDLLKAGLAASASSLFPAPVFASPSASIDPASSQQNSNVRSYTFVLSDGDWRLGSFPFGEGERQNANSTQFDESTFREVKVPGEVQLQIGLEGMDLYYQGKELTQVNENEWWYRKRFSVPESFAGKRISLIFEGVDYFAAVWLNGKKLGEHEGCYVPFEYDVTADLSLGGDNQLTVKVTCPWLPEGRGFLEYMKGELAEVVPHIVTSFPSAPFVLGPNWDGLPAGGNAVFPMGLFRDVKLVASGVAVVDDLFVSTKALNKDGSATLWVSCSLRNFDQNKVSPLIEVTIAPDNFAGEPLTVFKRSIEAPSGQTVIAEEITIKNPQLWWTWDSGEQNLYRATATLSYPPNSLETRETIFGIRTIARKEDMSYWLNGKRLFLKGAWYPIADIFGSKPTRATYEKDLLLYQAANLNHLVNFTVIEKPDFYDLCDRLGILNFLEFPFTQFGPMEVLARSNPRRDIYIAQALSQVRQIIVLLRKHPSIVVWAPFAEAHMKGKGAGWGALGVDFDQYGYQEFSDTIRKIVAELSPGTVFHASFCDEGEQHFWMGNANWTGDTVSNYNQHFHANAGFISEYGTIALPVLETLERMLIPREMWSSQNTGYPRWYNLPIDVNAYSYQTSFDYVGFTGVLDRINQFVDQNIKSVNELVDDSQLYQAFIFKYATEAYRRKKYHSVNGTRIWAYGELSPGIRFNFLDYYRTPKMGYYYLKNAQERFAVNFAYEEALESQVSGKRLQIPVWVINDYPRAVAFRLRCEIAGLDGATVWSKDLAGEAASDSSRQVGLVDWTTDKPGVYVLQAHISENNGPLHSQQRTFIKVTPKLCSRPIRALLIGQKKYSLPIARMTEGMGLNVDVIDEDSIHNLTILRDPAQIRGKYDLVWLASFDSLWKLLDAQEAEGLKQAVSQGVGFTHSGGPGSFHGGSIQAALLGFTALAEALPVELRNRDDLFLGRSILGVGGANNYPVAEVQLASGAGPEWDAAEWNGYELDGFNRVQLKPDSKQQLTIMGNPLLVTGRYGEGRTVAFMGFTPEYVATLASWDSTIEFPYMLDQEFVSNPQTRAYFTLFMKMIVAATGSESATTYAEILAARNKPLFETLKDQPAAALQQIQPVRAATTGNKAAGVLTLSNGSQYARLVRMRAEWSGPAEKAPYLVIYGDSYFDLMPREVREIPLEFVLPEAPLGSVNGRLVIEGSNLAAVEVPVTLRS